MSFYRVGQNADDGWSPPGPVAGPGTGYQAPTADYHANDPPAGSGSQWDSNTGSGSSNSGGSSGGGGGGYSAGSGGNQSSSGGGGGGVNGTNQPWDFNSTYYNATTGKYFIARRIWDEGGQSYKYVTVQGSNAAELAAQIGMNPDEIEPYIQQAYTQAANTQRNSYAKLIGQNSDGSYSYYGANGQIASTFDTAGLMGAGITEGEIHRAQVDAATLQHNSYARLIGQNPDGSFSYYGANGHIASTFDTAGLMAAGITAGEIQQAQSQAAQAQRGTYARLIGQNADGSFSYYGINGQVASTYDTAGLMAAGISAGEIQQAQVNAATATSRQAELAWQNSTFAYGGTPAYSAPASNSFAPAATGGYQNGVYVAPTGAFNSAGQYQYGGTPAYGTAGSSLTGAPAQTAATSAAPAAGVGMDTSGGGGVFAGSGTNQSTTGAGTATGAALTNQQAQQQAAAAQTGRTLAAAGLTDYLSANAAGQGYSGKNFFGQSVTRSAQDLLGSGSATQAQLDAMQQEFAKQQRQAGQLALAGRSRYLGGFDPNQVQSRVAGM